MFLRNAVNAGLPALKVPDATTDFSDGDLGTFDLSEGCWRNPQAVWWRGWQRGVICPPS